MVDLVGVKLGEKFFFVSVIIVSFFVFGKDCVNEWV